MQRMKLRAFFLIGVMGNSRFGMGCYLATFAMTRRADTGEHFLYTRVLYGGRVL